MKYMLRVTVAILLTAFSVRSVSAQVSTLTNADVIHYVKVGMSEQAVTTMVTEAIKARAIRFDLSPSGVADLEGHGVSPAVIAAMRQPTPPAVVVTTPVKEPAAPTSTSGKGILTTPSPEVVGQAFETSAFCKQYRCANHKSWALKTGGTNHIYALNLTPAVSVEVPTKDGRLDHYGLMFYERDRLGETDLQLIDTLLRTIDAASASDAVRQFVRTNIERDAFQIRQARSSQFGRYRLWAGKVGGQQTVSIEPVGPTSAASQNTGARANSSNGPATTVPFAAKPAGTQNGAVASGGNEAISTMVKLGLIKRMDVKTGKFYIDGPMWVGFELDGKEKIVKVISKYREAEYKGLPQVTLYESRSGRELGNYGAFSGVTIK